MKLKKIESIVPGKSSHRREKGVIGSQFIERIYSFILKIYSKNYQKIYLNEFIQCSQLQILRNLSFFKYLKLIKKNSILA